jgi:2'-5' RNA ligase
VREGTWHVTLAYYGNVDDDAPLVAALTRAAARLAAPVTVTLGPRTERLGRQVLCVAAHGLDEVASAVRRETAASVQGDPDRFGGHLTVARARGKSSGPAAAVGLPFEATFEVTQLSLVESQLTAEGPVYRERATVAFGTGDLP